jgi:hypothetical protein
MRSWIDPTLKHVRVQPKHGARNERFIQKDSIRTSTSDDASLSGQHRPLAIFVAGLQRRTLSWTFEWMTSAAAQRRANSWLPDRVSREPDSLAARLASAIALWMPSPSVRFICTCWSSTTVHGSHWTRPTRGRWPTREVLRSGVDHTPHPSTAQLPSSRSTKVAASSEGGHHIEWI